MTRFLPTVVAFSVACDRVHHRIFVLSEHGDVYVIAMIDPSFQTKHIMRLQHALPTWVNEDANTWSVISCNGALVALLLAWPSQRDGPDYDRRNEDKLTMFAVVYE
jgi:hypothetical protein